MPGYIDLRPGQHISVQQDAGALDGAYVSVIRHVSPVGVRIDVPRYGDQHMSLQAGDDLLIMVDLQGRLYTFASRVESIDDGATGMLIERPRVVQQSERRQFFRLAMNIRPQYTAVVDEEGSERRRIEAIIIDISGGGLQLRAKQAPLAGDRVHIIFPLGDDQLEADFTVLAASALDADPPWLYRVNGRFVQLSRQLQERIIRFIFRQQIEYMKRGVR